MIEAGILDGDLVIVRAQEVAENRDIVVALLDDEATVKPLSPSNRPCGATPENPSSGADYWKRCYIGL